MKMFLLAMRNKSFSYNQQVGRMLSLGLAEQRHFTKAHFSHHRGVQSMLSQTPEMEIEKVEAQTIRENVRERYAQVARDNTLKLDSGVTNSCCGAPVQVDVAYSEQLGYSTEEALGVPEGANLGLGCGNPHAIAQIKAGDTVLDLGSGAGFDCFLAARRVGETGHVIGVDMTPDMIDKARANAQKGNYKQVEFRLGEIEALPVEDNTIDVIISNCVVNLSPNKPQVYREAARVLKPEGRIAISDVVATAEMPAHIKNDFELYTGCMAGATPVDQLESMLQEAGLENIRITVKEGSRTFIKGWVPDSGAENYVASATIEASKPRPVPQNQATVTTASSTSPVLRFSNLTMSTPGAQLPEQNCCSPSRSCKPK